MNATDTEIAALRKLQEADRKVATAQRELDALPHRKAILEVRTKKDGVFKKKIQVQDMLDEAEGRLADFVAEDEKLAARQAEIDATLQEVQGDYRAVAAHTRDLDGVRKRREKISVGLAQVEEQVNKINPVMKQIMQALSALEEKERELVESFQKTGGQLKQVIADGQAARTELAGTIDPALLREYEHARERCGGVALAELKDSSCSACRNSFDTSRLSKIRSQAPVATCPSCSRLLIVEGE